MSVFEEHPAVQDLRARQKALCEVERAKQTEIGAKVAKHETERREWEARCQAQILAGKPVPKEPTPLDLGADEFSASVFMQRRQELVEEERRLRVELADALLPDVEARMADRAAESVKTLVVLEAEMAEYSALASERSRLLAAKGRKNVPAVRDLAEYITVVRTGVLPLLPPPPIEKVSPIRRLGQTGCTNLPEPEDPYRTRRPNVRGARI